jgi:hypothetical protein
MSVLFDRYDPLVQMYLEKTIGKDSHPFTGLYHPYPMLAPNNMSDMITKISRDSPMLNWAFVDCKTFEVQYGSKSDSKRPHYSASGLDTR